MSFWGGMALWQKMCMVLGIAIGVTICIGGLKVAFNHWRLRKYEVAAEARKARLQQMRESRQIIQLQGEGVPFGVRAIEAGIEVEGVHISRPATPTREQLRGPGYDGASFRGSDNSISGQASPTTGPASIVSTVNGVQANGGSVSSQQQNQSSSANSFPRLVIPHPVYVGPSGPHSAALPFRGTSGERFTQPTLSSSQGVNSRYVPRNSSHLRFSEHGLAADQETLDRLEGNGTQQMEARGSITTPLSGLKHPSATLDTAGSPASFNIHHPSQTRPEYRSGQDKYIDRSSGSSSETASIESSMLLKQPRERRNVSSGASSGEDEIPIEFRPFLEDQDRHLDSLYNHRRSHAAEIGQLLPRTRKATSVTQQNLELSTGDLPKQLAEEKPQAGTSPGNPFATPIESPAEEMIPLESLSQDDSNNGVLATGRDGTAEGPSLALTPKTGHARSRSYPSVIRKVNSGFEILAPGTFGIGEASKSVQQPIYDGRDLEAGVWNQRKLSFVEKLRRGKVSSFTESV